MKWRKLNAVNAMMVREMKKTAQKNECINGNFWILFCYYCCCRWCFWHYHLINCMRIHVQCTRIVNTPNESKIEWKQCVRLAMHVHVLEQCSILNFNQILFSFFTKEFTISWSAHSIVMSSNWYPLAWLMSLRQFWSIDNSREKHARIEPEPCDRQTKCV